MERKSTALVCELRRFVRSPVAFLCLFAAAWLFLGGCGPASTDEPDAPSDQEQAREAARIVCGRDGTRVLTPVVEARPDGVHLVIDNRLDAGAGYSFENPEVGAEGGGAPPGESEHVVGYPPGEVRVGCEKPPVDGVGTDYENVRIVDPEGYYRPVELQCKGGMAVGGGPQYAAGARGRGGDPVEMVRRGLSDRLREGDTVELAGYPKSKDSKIVRVVRDGRVVATVAFFRESGSWLENSTSSCAGF